MIGANPVELTTRITPHGKVTSVIWKLSEPQTLKAYDYYEDKDVTTEYTHVETSGSEVPDIPETYVFACDANGRWVSASEIAGSFRGSIDHGRAIAGYLASVNRDEDMYPYGGY